MGSVHLNMAKFNLKSKNSHFFNLFCFLVNKLT
jgi:hypothetical protein